MIYLSHLLATDEMKYMKQASLLSIHSLGGEKNSMSLSINCHRKLPMEQYFKRLKKKK